MVLVQIWLYLGTEGVVCPDWIWLRRTKFKTERGWNSITGYIAHTCAWESTYCRQFKGLLRLTASHFHGISQRYAKSFVRVRVIWPSMYTHGKLAGWCKQRAAVYKEWNVKGNRSTEYMYTTWRVNVYAAWCSYSLNRIQCTGLENSRPVRPMGK